MSLGILFWVIWVIALIFVGYSSWDDRPGLGRGVVAFILFGILGWAVFGPLVK